MYDATNEPRRSICLKEKTFRLYKKYETSEHLSDFIRLRALIKTQITRVYNNYFINVEHSIKNDPKKF